MSQLVSRHISIANGEAIALEDIPVTAFEAFREAIVDAVEHWVRVSAFFAQPVAKGRTRLWAILAYDSQSRMIPLVTEIDAAEYPSLTPICPQLHWFEREVFEQCGIRPKGHPWLKPIRFSGPLKENGGPDQATGGGVGLTDFFGVEGEEVHEVAVGPVHAGIIEPGHFRFQCHGEDVLHLEISLGYQHRGVEERLLNGPDRRTIHYMETLSGDTTVGHAMAYGSVMEALCGVRVSERAASIRAVALELERMANHTGDLGALAGDVGFLPTMSYCGRIRGDVLNMTALLCGNRFGRNLVVPGGAAYDLTPEMQRDLSARLAVFEKDASVAVDLLWKTSSVMARFEGTGALDRKLCDAIGLVGPAARACGADRDVRVNFPTGAYALSRVPMAVEESGDVLARARVRWSEIENGLSFIRERLDGLPGGACSSPVGAPAPLHLAVGLVEGWRGEICHVALTDAKGRFCRYKVVDPSFHNWFGLACALRNQQISDFPLCNKSFNLSYCGHDL